MSPNPLVIERYRRHAAGYDGSAERTMGLRRRAIALLRLQPGQTVIDAGAGTGLSYAGLRQGVGLQGRVLAFEQSPEMFALAQARVLRERWTNVWHVNETAETVRLPASADAVLFNYVHDICRSPVAVANILSQLEPGARVVMAGMNTMLMPNITPGKLTWSAAEIADYLKTGFTPDYDSVGGTMVEVQANMAELPDEDRAAIAAYLKAVPSVKP